MDPFSLKERIFVVKRYYQSQNSINVVLNEFVKEFVTVAILSADDILDVINCFEKFGHVERNLKIIENDDLDKKSSSAIIISSELSNLNPKTRLKTEFIDFAFQDTGEFDLQNDENDTLVDTHFQDNDDISNEEVDEEDDDEYIPLIKIREKLKKPKSNKIFKSKTLAALEEILKNAEFVEEENAIVETEVKVETDMQPNEESEKPLEKKEKKSRSKNLCPLCGKIFTRSTRLKIHMESHEKTCNICGHHFRNKDNHMATHTGEKLFECSICFNKFRDMSRLKNHMISHSDARPFECDLCNKTFKSKDRLHGHKKTHSTERPVKCDVCGKGFLAQSDLRKHSRVHTGEKPFICSYCGKCFTSSNSLHVHNRTHTGEKPYKCETCGKEFSVSSILVMHRRIHTGERPYKCKYCDKDFYDSGTCRSHERTHTGDYPYKCHLCGKAHNHPSNLKSHMRHAHKEKSGDLVREMESLDC